MCLNRYTSNTSNFLIDLSNLPYIYCWDFLQNCIFYWGNVEISLLFSKKGALKWVKMENDRWEIWDKLLNVSSFGLGILTSAIIYPMGYLESVVVFRLIISI